MQERWITSQEKIVLDRILKSMRGNDLLQIGGSSDGQFLENARVSRRFYLSSHGQNGLNKSFIRAELDALPIQSESIDIILLLHELDGVQNPRSILQEAHRVLRPNGQLIILGFNRFCLANLLSREKKCARIQKIKKNLCRLNFSITQFQTFCFQPSNYYFETLGQLLFPYFGSVFVITATKNILGVTPIMNYAPVSAAQTRF